MFDALIEYHHVAGLGLNGHCRNGSGLYSPEIRTLLVTRLLCDSLKGVAEVVAIVVATRNESETAGVLGQGVKIEGQFDCSVPSFGVEIGVPVSVSDVVIARPSRIVEVVSQKRCDCTLNSRVIK